MEVNTVDAYQGREKDIIIFNCVRSNNIKSLRASLGFLIDERRLNVAITRPRHFLYIIGNSRTLEKCDFWKNMISYCKENTLYVPLSCKHESKVGQKRASEHPFDYDEEQKSLKRKKCE